MSKLVALAACLFLFATASATEIVLKNPDFEKPMAGDRIPGWSRTQHAGARAYEITSDKGSHAKGKSSIRMLRTSEQAYGLISQQIDVPDLGGRLIELTAALKSKDVGKNGWVMVLTFKNFSNILGQVRATPVTGDTEWEDIVIRKVAPPAANRVDVGFLLLDGGTGWVDNVRLHTIDEEKRSPELEPEVPKDEKRDVTPPAREVKAADTTREGQVGL